MEVTLSELLDRYSIARLKTERLQDDRAKAEFDFLAREVDLKIASGLDLNPYTEQLYALNGQIWDLEAGIRAGREGEISLEEVGRIALAVRDINKKRVSVKNEIVKKFNSGFLDIKMNHASE